MGKCQAVDGYRNIAVFSDDSIIRGADMPIKEAFFLGVTDSVWNGAIFSA